MLHILPHWNWPVNGLFAGKQAKVIDVWAYYNNADEVELFLNGQSLGVAKEVVTFVDTYNGKAPGSELLVDVNTGCVYAFPDVAGSTFAYDLVLEDIEAVTCAAGLTP